MQNPSFSSVPSAVARAFTRTSLLQLLLACGLALGAGRLLVEGSATSVRWSVYLLIGPLAFLGLFFSRNRAVLTAALFLPLFLFEGTLISQRPFGPVRIGISNAVFLVVFASVLFQGRVPQLKGYGAALVVLVASAFMSAVAAVGDASVQFAGFQSHYLEGAGYFALGTCLWRNEQDVHQGVRALVACGIVLAGLQFIFYWSGAAWLTPDRTAASAEVAWRYGGPIGNPNSLADLFAMIMALALVPAVVANRMRSRLLGASLAILFAWSIFLTGSRGGTMTAVAAAGLAMLAGTIRTRRGTAAVLAIILLSVAISGVSDGLFPEVYQQSIDRWQTKGLEDVRTAIWASTTGIIQDSPLGIGHDPYDFMSRLSMQDPLHEFANPHNIYLSIAVVSGIPALLAFLYLLIRVIWRSVAALAAPLDHRAFGLRGAVLLSIIVFAIGGMTEPIFDSGMKLNHFFWFLMGTAVWFERRRFAAPARPPDASEESAECPPSAS